MHNLLLLCGCIIGLITLTTHNHNHNDPHIVNIAKTQRRAILNEIWFKSYCAKIDIGES